MKSLIIINTIFSAAIKYFILHRFNMLAVFFLFNSLELKFLTSCAGSANSD